MAQINAAAVDNPMSRGLMAHLAGMDRREAVSKEAERALRLELIDALLREPQRQVWTPGWPAPRASAAEVVADAFDCPRTGDALLHEVLVIVGQCAAGRADHELHLRASALIARLGAAHAQFHADDAARALLDDEA